ncbi:MAG: glycosyltransferase family 2 protein [Calditrichia bacterium]
MIWLFFLSLYLIIHTYLIYPILIFILSNISNNKIIATELNQKLPTITFIIAAYNEEKVIEEKINNTLNLNYPKEKMEVIIVADGSNDRTVEIVKSYISDSVKLLYHPARKGKTAALNRAFKSAENEIIIMSDANNMFKEDALLHLVKYFENEQVGGVCGVKKIKNSADRDSSTGDSMYWKYESFIKKCESDYSSIVGADGEIFAVRRNLIDFIPEHIINDDASISLQILKKNKRVLYEMNAISYEEASINIEDDFNVKVRMVAGGYQTVSTYWKDICKLGWFYVFQFISHKLLRWMVPVWGILTVLISLFLLHLWWIKLYLLIIILSSMLAIIGYFSLKKNKKFYFFMYFYAMNLAALMGFIRFFGLNSVTDIWRKAER